MSAKKINGSEKIARFTLFLIGLLAITVIGVVTGLWVLIWQVIAMRLQEP